jgi:hypothetical protein
MIISNLNHCQTVAAPSEILGGGGRWGKSSVIKNKVYQNVDAYAVALNFSYSGDAVAYNETKQSVKIDNY